MSPKKPPRDRDVFIRKTSPEGLSVTTPRASSEQEGWSADTGTHEALEGVDEDTPVNMPTVEAQAEARLRSRVKETNVAVRAVRNGVETTNAGIDTLRLETKRDVGRLEGKINAVDSKVDRVTIKVDKVVDKLDEHQGVMLKVVSTVGELKGAFTEMTKTNDQRRQHEVITFQSAVKIDQEEKIAEIKNDVDASKQKRSFKYKIGSTLLKILSAGGIVAATALATHFIERC